MKKIIIIFFLIVSIFAFVPNTVYAANVSDGILIADTTSNIGKGFEEEDQTCEGDNSILGNPKDENSVAWLLDKLLTYVTIAGMLAVLVFSTIDFLSVITSGKDETMKKAFSKLAIRLLLVGLLFFLPTITNALLDLFGFTSQSTCGIQQ